MKSVDKPDAGNLQSFYGDMERMLLAQIEQDPKHAGLRLKLIEIYYETGRRGDFLPQAQALRQLLNRRTQGAEWSRVASMGRMLGFEKDPLFDFSGSETIEFVEPLSEAASVRNRPRFAEQERYRPFFQALASQYEEVLSDPAFVHSLDMELVNLANRPAALVLAQRLTEIAGGAKLFLKREDLSPPGSRLLVSIVGQAMLARRLGRNTLVTFTSTGNRGVVTAAVAARMGMRAICHMDDDSFHAHALDAFHMRVLGAKVRHRPADKAPEGDIRYAALDEVVDDAQRAFFVSGLEFVPPPYPAIARVVAAVTGRETLRQLRSQAKRIPDLMVARGANRPDPIGWFEPLLAQTATRLVCVDPSHEFEHEHVEKDIFNPTAGKLEEADKRLDNPQDRELEIPPFSREQNILKSSGRVEQVCGTADHARSGILNLSRSEGLVPAIETAQCVGWACEEAATMDADQAVVVMFEQRADTDLFAISNVMGKRF